MIPLLLKRIRCLTALAGVITVFAVVSQAQEVKPILEFPQSGLDDEAAYNGYMTRFFRDSEGNTVQAVINQLSGRVVNVWADASNESISLTARDSSGKAAKLSWGSEGAAVGSDGKMRYLQYTLRSNSPQIEIGLFLLGSMRKERDYQYQQKHLLPFDSPTYVEEELTLLLQNLERLPLAERTRHLALLSDSNVEHLRERLLPSILESKRDSLLVASIEQATFDGRNHLSLELGVGERQATIRIEKDRIVIRSNDGQPVTLSLRLGTDSPSLTPISRENIFTQDFMQFYSHIKQEYDNISRTAVSSSDSSSRQKAIRFQWLDREVKSVELLSSKEKLMAGLPNFATYFGRDMMMTALMMEPVWSPSMSEHVIASVLKKLSPTGDVSHEEALGGQAIRENAGQYSQFIEEYFQNRNRGDDERADTALIGARAVLADMQLVRENYIMIDDDFQLPVLESRYLTRTDVPAERKRAFLLGPSGKQPGGTRLALMMENFLYDVNKAAPYVEHPDALHLVSFPRWDNRGWLSASWRDSGAGYARGRFAMDVNVIWVPIALESIQSILALLPRIGFTAAELDSLVPQIHGTVLAEYLRNPELLDTAVRTWRGSSRHFTVQLSPQDLRESVKAKLDWLDQNERICWSTALKETKAEARGIDFLALSIDSLGKPIAVVSTDPATWLFLDNFTEKLLNKSLSTDDLTRLIDPFTRAYPAGLFVRGLGPLVANDTFAPREVWENFKRDAYHSPRVVWGREVNLFLLGLSKQIIAARDDSGRPKNPSLKSYIKRLRTALETTVASVEASGLKHNELWTYTAADGKIIPTRYATSSDIQLWNLTDLAVQFLLDRISTVR